MRYHVAPFVSLCKRRGFVFQSSEIYGGTGSCWDYGPLGVELKNKIKQAWWRDFVQRRPDMVGLDASILMHAMVWKASGHVDHFTDPMVDCRECRHRFRADQLAETPWVLYVDRRELVDEYARLREQLRARDREVQALKIPPALCFLVREALLGLLVGAEPAVDVHARPPARGPQARMPHVRARRYSPSHLARPGRWSTRAACPRRPVPALSG